MRYRPMTLQFMTHIRGKRFVVSATSNQITGIICTVYWNHKPIFNLVSDRHAQCPSPMRHTHEWGFARWGIVRRK